MKVLPILLLVTTGASAQYSTLPRGQKYSEEKANEYKLYFTDTRNNIVSPWHDVPLYTRADRKNQTYNMIVEIPRFSQAKFEIHREHMMNPIVQDKKDGKLRFVPNVFPWHGHVCNYGAFPQTWENPFHKDEWTGFLGDKDPIDVCELGSKPVPTGTVLPVKVLGILAMIDGGETDWKVMVMDSKEAQEKDIDDLDDLREKNPGVLEAAREFFRVYKIPSGKPENIFAYDGEIKDKEFAVEVISYTHDLWKEMINNCTISGADVGTFNTTNTLQDSACKVDVKAAKSEVDNQPQHTPTDAKLPDTVDVWSYLPPGSVKSSGARICHSLTLVCIGLLYLLL